MTDRELLELAAKAAGWAKWRAAGDGSFYVSASPNWNEQFAEWRLWKPLDDGDEALRLAALKLMRLDFDRDTGCVHAEYRRNGLVCDASEPLNGSLSRSAAAKRAIVRALAEIGKAMP